MYLPALVEGHGWLNPEQGPRYGTGQGKATRSDQHQGADAPLAARRHEPRDDAAEREPDQVELRGWRQDDVEPGCHEIGEAVGGMWLVRRIGVAESRHVRHEHAESRGERQHIADPMRPGAARAG